MTTFNQRLDHAFEWVKKLKDALIDTQEKRITEAERKMLEKYERLEKENQEKYNRIFYLITASECELQISILFSFFFDFHYI